MGYEESMLYKKPLLHIFLVCLILVSNVLFAHNPDLSNIIISKTNNGQVILQINSSLTAFQQEVNFINGEGFYKTPEEFKHLVINHFKKSFSIIINEKDTLQFKNPQVLLGHETKLVTEIIGLPGTVTSIRLQNNLFKNIYNNQSAVIFLLDGFPKEKYQLNKDNNHHIYIKLKDGIWNDLETEEASFKISYVFISTALLAFLFYFIRKRKMKST